jgi:hypothetical protein
MEESDDTFFELLRLPKTPSFAKKFVSDAAAYLARIPHHRSAYRVMRLLIIVTRAC